MKLICVWTALMLLPPPLAAAAQGEAATPQVIGSREERAAAAGGYYTQGDFVRAALGFEGLHRDFPDNPDYLFNAAASRHGAGHAAHAVAYTREYLALRSVSLADRQEAEAQLREAEGSVGWVEVSVAAEAGGQGPLLLTARYVPRESGDLRPDLPFPVVAGAPTKLALDPGVWTIRADGAGFVATEQRVELTRGQAATLSLQLVRVRVEDRGPVVSPSVVDVPPAVARRAMLGFEVSGGIVGATGLIMVAVGAAGVHRAATCSDPTNQTPCALNLRDGLLQRDVGVAAFGASAGLLVGGLTWKSRDAATRRRAWIAEAVVGSAALVAGMVLVPISFGTFNQANDGNKISANDAPSGGSTPTWDEHHRKFRHSTGHAVASAIFGLGLGMVASAGSSLVLQRRHIDARPRVGGMAGRGLLGLTLSGQF